MLAVIDVDVVPRVGERLAFANGDDQDALGYSVEAVQHMYMLNYAGTLMEHVVTVRVERVTTEPYQMYLMWETPDAIPDGLACADDDVQLYTDVVPAVGDVLELMREQHNPLALVTLCSVEVIARHYVATLRENEAAFALFHGDSIGLVVRRVETRASGLYRIIAHAN